MLGILGGLLLTQPDTDTFIVIGVSLVAMYIVAGGRKRDVFLLGLIGILGIGALAFTRPYVMSRLTTFINPTENSLGSSYQIQQSLIAIGSGGITGRGFGQSVQKFGLLPEPVGDSIFAVAGEEFGFVGLVTLISIFLFFSSRAIKIAKRAPTPFSSFIVVGLVTYMIVESFINMAAMVGILPLSGIPLLFVSQGGTALLFALSAVGIMMNVSRYTR
jgi:cell division protein FtsW